MNRRWSDFCECDSVAGIVLKGFFKHRMEIRPASMRDKWRCITTSSTINTISSHNTADPSLSQTFHFPYQSASSWLVTFHPLLPPNICAIAPSPSTETLHKWNPHLWSQMQKNSSTPRSPPGWITVMHSSLASAPLKLRDRAARLLMRVLVGGIRSHYTFPSHTLLASYPCLEFSIKSLHRLLHYININNLLMA